MRTTAAGQTISNACTKSDLTARIDAAFGPFVERLLGRLGITQTEAAESIGVARQTFAKALEAGKSPRVSWLYALPEAARVELAADLAGDEYVVVRRASTEATTAEHFARFGAIASATSALTGEYAKALSDGDVDIVEERDVLVRLSAVRDEAEKQIRAIEARQRGLKVVGGAA